MMLRAINEPKISHLTHAEEQETYRRDVIVSLYKMRTYTH